MCRLGYLYAQVGLNRKKMLSCVALVLILSFHSWSHQCCRYVGPLECNQHARPGDQGSRQNIATFLNVLRSYGTPSKLLFEVDDLVEVRECGFFLFPSLSFSHGLAWAGFEESHIVVFFI